jgi:hypothetical protein
MRIDKTEALVICQITPHHLFQKFTFARPRRANDVHVCLALFYRKLYLAASPILTEQ